MHLLKPSEENERNSPFVRSDDWWLSCNDESVNQLCGAPPAHFMWKVPYHVYDVLLRCECGNVELWIMVFWLKWVIFMFKFDS